MAHRSDFFPGDGVPELANTWTGFIAVSRAKVVGNPLDYPAQLLHFMAAHQKQAAIGRELDCMENR